MLEIIKNDPWLKPHSDAIEGRHNYYLKRLSHLTKEGKISLSDFANGHKHFGLNKTTDGWVLREWAPNATDIHLIGTFNNWQKLDEFRLKKTDAGVWEIKLSPNTIKHGDLYKIFVKWEGGSGERIPAWSKRVVQDSNTYIFSAQVWEPEVKYTFKHSNFKPNTSPLLIYETHIGMSTSEEK